MGFDFKKYFSNGSKNSKLKNLIHINNYLSTDILNLKKMGVTFSDNGKDLVMFSYLYLKHRSPSALIQLGVTNFKHNELTFIDILTHQFSQNSDPLYFLEYVDSFYKLFIQNKQTPPEFINIFSFPDHLAYLHYKDTTILNQSFNIQEEKTFLGELISIFYQKSINLFKKEETTYNKELKKCFEQFQQILKHNIEYLTQNKNLLIIPIFKHYYSKTNNQKMTSESELLLSQLLHSSKIELNYNDINFLYRISTTEQCCNILNSGLKSLPEKVNFLKTFPFNQPDNVQPLLKDIIFDKYTTLDLSNIIESSVFKKTSYPNAQEQLKNLKYKKITLEKNELTTIIQNNKSSTLKKRL